VRPYIVRAAVAGPRRRHSREEYVKKLVAPVVLCALALMATPAVAAPLLPQGVQPYGTNDAGGFLNVLPPGENGLDNAAQLAGFQASGTYPPHANDQLHLYTDLLYASPTLSHAQIGSYFKDATFGVKTPDIGSVEQPRSDVTIVRDGSYGIPHVYGTTRGGVMFGAGYAGAEDRLFLMDVLRHTGRAQLSSFIGGSDGNRAMDRTQWAIAPYTEADLQSQVDNAPKIYGAAGVALIDDVNNFVAGINAYVNAALLNPNLLPGEYAAIGKTPTQWTATDVIAEASLIGGIFGKGGGNELRSAQTLQAFEQRFGVAGGQKAWGDFREHNDPEAPTTVSAPFPYETGSPFATTGLAMPDAGSVSFPPIGPPLGGASGAAKRVVDGPVNVAIPNDGSFGSALLNQFYGNGRPLSSNWELVAARHSATGHPIAVMGPQVGYYVPQILMEEDLHGPGIDARGASFPGVNLYVELGHGRDYAWSATTATSDNVDTFAEVLCQDDVHYMYKGQCLAMDKLDQVNSWTPNASDHTAPGSETLTAYRTVHGIVYARGTVSGQKVAFVSARTTYFHEADSALGFSELNDPGFVTGPQQFQKAAFDINFLFNWSYVDANHIAYFHSGWLPQRAAGTSPDFPILGTGQYDWQGYDPSLHTEPQLPFAQHPQAIDPDYLVSWNNKQAPQFSAADDHYAYGSLYRSQLIADAVAHGIAGASKMPIEKLVSAMDEAATKDIRIVKLWPALRQVLGSPSDPALRDAIAKLDAWYADGGHRRDLTNHDITKPGTYQHNDAITIMDAWWPKLLAAEFQPTLGKPVFDQLQVMQNFGDATPGGQPSAPDEADGWYGYTYKDLRDLIAGSSRPAARKSRCRTVRNKHGRRVRVCTKRKKATRRAAPASTVAKAKKRHRKAKAKRPAAIAPVMPAGAYSQVYCGGGSVTACRAALLASLKAALAVTPTQIYGQGSCASNPQASCFDMNSSVIAGGISIAPFPFQNRPTFQQVVELTQKLGR
jgi:acyl-homoserine lactone acylase PvdQ